MYLFCSAHAGKPLTSKPFLWCGQEKMFDASIFFAHAIGSSAGNLPVTPSGLLRMTLAIEVCFYMHMHACSY